MLVHNGQLTGTAIGSKLYAQIGRKGNGSANRSSIGAGLVVFCSKRLVLGLGWTEVRELHERKDTLEDVEEVLSVIEDVSDSTMGDRRQDDKNAADG